MRAMISLPLAGLFVFLAGFNAWMMLTSRGASLRSRRLRTQAHRVCGYSFIALFAIFCYFMLLRVRGSSDELSPRLILHMGLALALAPLLLAKVLVVRYRRAAWGVVIALGISILVTTFTLVAMNVSVHYLRNISPHKVPFAISLRVVVVVIILAAVALFARAKQTNPKPDSAEISPTKPADQPSTNQRATLTLTLARIDPQTPDAKTLRFLLPQAQRLSVRPGQFAASHSEAGREGRERSISPVAAMKDGERGRNRTFNLLIKSQLLCQLSYAPTVGFGWWDKIKL